MVYERFINLYGLPKVPLAEMNSPLRFSWLNFTNASWIDFFSSVIFCACSFQNQYTLFESPIIYYCNLVDGIHVICIKYCYSYQSSSMLMSGQEQPLLSRKSHYIKLVNKFIVNHLRFLTFTFLCNSIFKGKVKNLSLIKTWDALAVRFNFLGKKKVKLACYWLNRHSFLGTSTSRLSLLERLTRRSASMITICWCRFGYRDPQLPLQQGFRFRSKKKKWSAPRK